ncbi:DUF7535 family protein [Halobacterium sp. KA-4]
MTDAVSRRRTDYSNAEMSVVGYLIATALGVLLLPLLPILVLLWIGTKLT